MKNYILESAEKLPTGIILHNFIGPGSLLEVAKYHAVRFALVWPTSESPAYFLGAGEETWDEELFNPASGRGILRVFEEYEHEGLSLDSLFDRLTDAVTACLGEVIYADTEGAGGQEDYANLFADYLDRRDLRNIHLQQAPYKDFPLRLGVVKDWDKEGELLISKDSPLYQDLKGIAAIDLQDKPEIRFYRLNALSYLCAGFQKYRPSRPLRVRMPGNSHPQGWMGF